MIWVDYVIIGVLALSALIGVIRGLIREVVALAVWIAAFAAAWIYHEPVAEQLTPWVSTPSLRLGLAVVLLIFGILILGALVGYLLGLLVDRTGLTGTDRLLGMLFGGARGVVLVAALTFVGGATPLIEDPWWDESRLIPYFEQIAETLLGYLPQEVIEKLPDSAILNDDLVDEGGIDQAAEPSDPAVVSG